MPLSPGQNELTGNAESHVITRQDKARATFSEYLHPQARFGRTMEKHSRAGTAEGLFFSFPDFIDGFVLPCS